MLAVATFLLTWQLLAGLRWLELPAPLAVARAFGTLLLCPDPLFGKTLPQMVRASLLVVLKGAGLAFLLAVPLGILMGAFEPAARFWNGVVELLRPVPPLAWIPLAYLMFARFPAPTAYVQVFTVFMGAFFPALLNTIYGVRAVEPVYLQAAHTLGASRVQQLLLVRLPAALPAILTGLRLGLGVGWMCVVAAEFVGGRVGAGYYIWAVYNLGGRTEQVAAGILAIGLVGYAMNQGILFAEKRLVPWR